MIMEPLRKEQAEGVRKDILRMTAELKGTMARTGCAKLSDIDASLLHQRMGW